jgi:ankyrin repeat protein
MCASEPDFMQMLIDRGADIHAIDGQGKSVLYHHGRYLDTARILIKKGAQLQKQDPILVYAITGDFPCSDCVYLFMDNGVDVNSPSRNGETVLMNAVQMDELQFVQNLLNRGADVRIADLRGSTALHKVRYPEFAELLLARGADVNARDLDGITPLITGRSAKIAEVLIRNGAQVNAQAKDGSTALIRQHDPVVTELLLKSGADVKIRSKDGQTALIAAAEHRDVLSATLLLQKGIDVNAQTINGKTALKIAIQNNDIQMGALLRKAGAR